MIRPHALALFLLTSCTPASIEGDEAGECDDGIDNDQDGPTDCDDDECAAATACAAGDDDTDNNADTEDADTDACADADQDGHADEACGGDDCDDDDATRHPSAVDLCDTTVDENCDGDPEGVGCEDARGWSLVREEALDVIPVDAVVQTNWQPRSVAGRDAVCVSPGSNHYLELPHGDAAGADRLAVQVDVYMAPSALDAVVRPTQASSSYLRLRLWQSQNTTKLIEYHDTLGGESDLHSGSSYADQTWHTLRVELDRATGDVGVAINDTAWFDGTAFLASLGGSKLSLYGYGGDTGSDHVCYSNLSVWTGGEVGSP